MPVRIRFGAGVLGALDEVIHGRRALVVSEPPVLAIDAVAAAVAGLPLYQKPPGEPTPELVADAAARVAAERPEVRVADRPSTWPRRRGWWPARAGRSKRSWRARRPSRCRPST